MKNEVADQISEVNVVNGTRELSDDAITTMESLAMTLKPVYLRMKQEGWVFKSGILQINHDRNN